jgi:hypothetical protein
MPKAKPPGRTGMYVELPDELVARLDDLVRRLPLGGKADHVRMALERHLASPPTVAVPELAPTAVASSPAPAPAKKAVKKPRTGLRKPT